MPRRSKPALLALFASRRSRPTSTADGPGCLYAFSDTAHKWKEMEGSYRCSEAATSRIIGPSSPRTQVRRQAS
ncbi:hypothetical protein F5878DRAFT_668245 [Lentinula raphanica]|uniref:Uncharacterized protein n=1 Tax=Lentinula raphanica TaxID=153919 RepID=A0AA38NUJ8_9AGAR|nr:hypothetical protein F5878DRAFT_668245 [Lentinula raphanica]